MWRTGVRRKSEPAGTWCLTALVWASESKAIRCMVNKKKARSPAATRALWTGANTAQDVLPPPPACHFRFLSGSRHMPAQPDKGHVQFYASRHRSLRHLLGLSRVSCVRTEPPHRGMRATAHVPGAGLGCLKEGTIVPAPDHRPPAQTHPDAQKETSQPWPWAPAPVMPPCAYQGCSGKLNQHPSM